MKSGSEHFRNGRSEAKQVIYRTICQNPGCGFVFNLAISQSNVGILGSRIACPRCRRPGGALEGRRRIGERLFSSRLAFR